jgi:RNA methyltransferase, TrmH family
MIESLFIRARDNPLLKELRKLKLDNLAYRSAGRFWIEGDHLCKAALVRGWNPELAVFSESYWPVADGNLTSVAIKNVVLPDQLFSTISSLEMPTGMGFVLKLMEAPTIVPGYSSVILDRIQDAGNVGSILRSACAFGFQQVLALQGTAALWGGKVLRAGMGAHFGLSLKENLRMADLVALNVPLIVTSSHQGELIQNQKLPWPCAWVFGHEGQGIEPHIFEKAATLVRIGQPGGEESLNVAAAAAICMHASSAAQ